MKRQLMKGQYFSFDAIIASVVFVLTVLALMSYWNSVKAGMETYSDETTKEAIRISDLLLSPRSHLKLQIAAELLIKKSRDLVLRFPGKIVNYPNNFLRIANL